MSTKMTRMQLLTEAKKWDAKKFEARNMSKAVRRMVRQRATYYRNLYEATFAS